MLNNWKTYIATIRQAVKEEDEKVVRLKNPSDDIDNDDDDVCKAAKVDLVCTNCHLWRPNEQLPRGASLLPYSMIAILYAMLYSQCPMLYSMLPRRLFLHSFPLLIQFPPRDAQP